MTFPPRRRIRQNVNSLVLAQYFGEGFADLSFVGKLRAMKLIFETGRRKRRRSLPPGSVIPVQQDRVIF
jgi:hypothetical protein